MAEKQSQPHRSDTEIRSYAWSAPVDGEVHLMAEEIRRDHGLALDDELTEEHWIQSARDMIGRMGGPPSDIDWPTEIRRTR